MQSSSSSSDHRITLDALPGSAMLASTPAPPSTWLYTAPSSPRPGAPDDPPSTATGSVSLQALFGMYDARLLPYVDWMSRNGFARVDHVGALTPDERRSVYGAVRPPIPYSLQLRLERLIRTAMGDPMSHSQRHAQTQTCDTTHAVVAAKVGAHCVDQATQWADPDAASPGSAAPDDRPAPPPPPPPAAAIVPGEGADGLYSCPVCAAMFTRQDALTVHYRAHTGARPFVCARATCGKGFRSRTCLQRHERGHVDERQFVCALCGKAFKTVDALGKHRKVHTQDKAHQCDICRRSFRRKDNLAAHRLIHTRAYPCDLCDQTFRWKSGLAAHRRTHADSSSHNEVPDG